MSCIVGIVDGSSVVMGADSCIGGEGWQDITLHEKVFVKELADGTKLGVGFAGQPRVAQVLRYCVPWWSLRSTSDATEWMVLEMIPALRRALTENDVPGGNDGQSGVLDGNLLIALHGQLFEIQAHWQVHRPAAPFAVVGIDDAALGAIQTALALGCDDRHQIIDLALQAASRWAFGVMPPFKHWVVD